MGTVLSIADQERALFARWSKDRTSFVMDGVVDEVSYATSSPKLMFVLKEPNDPAQGNWDLREFVRAGARPSTWQSLARWVRGIRELEHDHPWSEIEQVSADERRDALRSICVMNVKKMPGGHTANGRALWAAGTEDAAFLQEQFYLYDADLVISCGQVVTDILHARVKIAEGKTWKETHRGLAYLEYKPGKFVVAFSHPEARVPAPLLYYGLIDNVREILRRRRARSRAPGICDAQRSPFSRTGLSVGHEHRKSRLIRLIFGLHSAILTVC